MPRLVLSCLSPLRSVRYTREAVADAENLRLISEAASGQVKMVTQGALG